MKGYSFDALVDVLYPCNYQVLPVGANLNSYNSDAFVGVYRQTANVNATIELGYPVAQAGSFEVLPAAMNIGVGCTQRYTVYNNGDTYTRSIYGNTISAWQKLISSLDVYKVIYPVGIVVTFDVIANPNTLFPGTTWTQITDSRQVRAAPNNAAAVGTVGGTDSTVLTAAMMPVHGHSIAQHTHTVAAHSHAMATHTHTVAAHTHGMAQHSHDVASHVHSMNHSHTAASSSAGGHQHFVANGTTQTGTGDTITLNSGNYLCGAFGPAGFGFTEYALKGNATGPDRGLTNITGAHNHPVTVSTLTGNTGLAGSTTTTNGATATAANAAQTTAAGGAAATSNNLEQTTSTSGATATGNAGGTTAVPTAGTWHMYSIWKRTA